MVFESISLNRYSFSRPVHDFLLNRLKQFTVKTTQTVSESISLNRYSLSRPVHDLLLNRLKQFSDVLVGISSGRSRKSIWGVGGGAVGSNMWPEATDVLLEYCANFLVKLLFQLR